MKLGPVTKLDKRNKTTSKKSDVDVMSENCEVIATFWIFCQFGAVRRPDSGHRLCKIYVFSYSNLLFYKKLKTKLKKVKSPKGQQDFMFTVYSIIEELFKTFFNRTNWFIYHNKFKF